MEVLGRDSLSSWDVRAYDYVDSTNLIIKEAMEKGNAEGICATALRQKGGYGRQGRVWESPIGGLYASFALYPAERNVALRDMPTLSLVMSLALRRALARMVEDADNVQGMAKGLAQVPALCIKWPNDVLYHGGKIAGISLELHSGGVCVGMGINVFPQAQPVVVSGKYSPSFINDEVVGDALDDHQRAYMGTLLDTLLFEVETCYLLWCKEGFEVFLDEYRACLAFSGTHVTLETIEGAVLMEGIIEDVDKQGSLLVRLSSGEVRAVSSGEVHVRALKLLGQ